jgi:hypothetical protein
VRGRWERDGDPASGVAGFRRMRRHSALPRVRAARPNPRGERRDGTGDEGGRGWSEIRTCEASSVQISAMAKLFPSPGALSSSSHLPRNGCAADILVEFSRGERRERRRLFRFRIALDAK